jgi:hypothetical protein
MSFDDDVEIPDRFVYRGAKVSGPRGKSALKELKKAGAINPVTTPTGHELLTITDARRLYEKIMKAAA